MQIHTLQTTPDPASRQRGSAMIVAVTTVLVIASVAAASLITAIARNSEVSSRMARMNALYAAESAVKEVLQTMNDEAAAFARGGPEVSYHDMQVVEGAYDWAKYQVTLHAIPGTDNWQLTGAGFCDSNGGVCSRRVMVALTALTKARTASRFQFAMFSDQTLTLNGNGFTDSYDSSLGPYLPQPASAPYSQSYQNSNGNIGSNGNIVNPAGGTELHGVINPGVGMSASFGGLSSGGGDPFPARIELPPVPDEEWQAARDANDNGSIVTTGGGSAYNPGTQALSISSQQTVTLGVPGGERRTYYFTSVSSQGSGKKINVVGPTTIYLNGNWTQNGSSETNALGAPTDFLIYGVGGGTLTINGSSGFGAGIYAPQMEIRFNGSGDMRGAYTARKITRNGNWSFHYDEALGRILEAPGEPAIIGFRIDGWLESSASD